MSSDNALSIMLFQSIHQVMKAEGIIRQAGYAYRIIPVPSQYSSECGMCIELDSSIAPTVLADLQKYSIEPKVVKK